MQISDSANVFIQTVLDQNTAKNIRVYFAGIS